MNESDAEESWVIESGLYVHWADKQVAEYIMCMNEEEGTLSLSLYTSFNPSTLFQCQVKVKQELLIWKLT